MQAVQLVTLARGQTLRDTAKSTGLVCLSMAHCTVCILLVVVKTLLGVERQQMEKIPAAPQVYREQAALSMGLKELLSHECFTVQQLS